MSVCVVVSRAPMQRVVSREQVGQGERGNAVKVKRVRITKEAKSAPKPRCRLVAPSWYRDRLDVTIGARGGVRKVMYGASCAL